MWKVVAGTVIHKPGRVREYVDTHVITGFESYDKAYAFAIASSWFMEVGTYCVILKDKHEFPNYIES